MKPVTPGDLSTREAAPGMSAFDLMSTDVPAAPATSLAPLPIDDSATIASSTRVLWHGVSLTVVSQLALGVVGVLALPMMTRNFGPSAYGDFSLFVTVLGVVTYQDFARQMLVQAGGRSSAPPSEQRAIARASLTAMCLLAIVVGFIILQPATACALAVAAFFHGVASRDYAALSLAGRVGTAGALRNGAWAIAFLAVTAGSFSNSGPLVYAWPFAIANLSIALAYRWLLGQPSLLGGAALFHVRGLGVGWGKRGGWLARASGWATLRASPNWPKLRRDASDLFGFTVAASVMVSVDRVLLHKATDDVTLGVYVAHSDLALKLNIFHSALAAALFPMFVHTVAVGGRDLAARRLMRLADWLVPAGFAVLLGLMWLERPLVLLVLGRDFLSPHHYYTWVLLGLFVQLFGFIITPWQRAQGDFATQRRAYYRSAILMVGAGVVLIPRYGGAGAIAAFLVSRTAELQLAIHEIRRLPASLLPRWKVALAGAMLAVLATFATLRSMEIL